MKVRRGTRWVIGTLVTVVLALVSLTALVEDSSRVGPPGGGIEVTVGAPRTMRPGVAAAA